MEAAISISLTIGLIVLGIATVAAIIGIGTAPFYAVTFGVALVLLSAGSVGAYRKFWRAEPAQSGD